MRKSKIFIKLRPKQFVFWKCLKVLRIRCISAPVIWRMKKTNKSKQNGKISYPIYKANIKNGLHKMKLFYKFDPKVFQFLKSALCLNDFL